MKNILVTGGAGFIGSHLVRRLAAEGDKIFVLIRESTGTERLEDIKSKIELVRCDLSDCGELQKIVNKIAPEGIFHLATSPIKSGVSAEDEVLVRTNILGAANLLKSISHLDYKYCVMAGSFLEYGAKDHPVREGESCAPSETYGITKLAATLFGQAEARNHHKPIVTLRIFTPYGPQIQKGRLVHEAIFKALHNEEIYLTSKSVTRDFIFVSDLVDLFMEASEKAGKYAGEIFNAGSGATVTLEKFAETALQITESKSTLSWGGKKSTSYDSSLWVADMAKTFSCFKWRPKHTLEDGLQKTVEWFKGEIEKV